MKFQNTNAVDTNGLLIAIKNFLAANGWTVVTDGTGGGGLSLEVQNANGHKFALTSTLATPTWFGQGVINDRRIHMDFDKAIIGLAAGYTGFRGFANDLTGPFPNIWLFTDDAATYFHLVAQASADRYTHMSFGNLDARGMHAEKLPFCVGLYWQYWSDQANFSNSNSNGNPFNNPQSGTHRVGQFGEASTLTDQYACCRIGCPDGLLDPALGFADGALQQLYIHNISDREYFRTVSGNNSSRPLDFASSIRNHSFTGGVNLAPLMMMTGATADGSLFSYLGDLPNICYVNMMGLSPGQVLTFAGDEWICFPLKQYSIVDACKFGASPQNKPSSAFYGLAYKKVGL